MKIDSWRDAILRQRFSLLTSTLSRLSALSDDQCSPLLPRYVRVLRHLQLSLVMASSEVLLKASAVCKTDVAVCKALADQIEDQMPS